MRSTYFMRSSSLIFSILLVALFGGLLRVAADLHRRNLRLTSANRALADMAERMFDAQA